MQILFGLTLIQGRLINAAPVPAPYITYLGIYQHVNIPLALRQLLHAWTSPGSGTFSVCVDRHSAHLCLLKLCAGFFFFFLINVVIKSGFQL